MADLEHPDITHIMKYGYPKGQEPPKAKLICFECNCGIAEGECYYHINGEDICEFCVNSGRTIAEEL